MQQAPRYLYPALGGIQIFYEQVLSLPRLTNNRFSLSQSPEANHAHAGWPDVSAKVDLFVANWYSLAKEIIDFNYFPKF